MAGGATLLALSAGFTATAAAGTAAAGTAATGTAAAGTTAVAGTGRAGGTALGRLAGQAVTWHGCPTGPDDELGVALEAASARCAEITVPLDYRRPAGRTISVAVARVPARDPAHRRGVLLLNPGGPGDPAMQMVIGLGQLVPEIAARYDLIGMDPRFVGRSTPLVCRWTTDTSMLSAGPTRRTFDESVAYARRLADGCAAGNRSLLPYATTRNTARDMDLLRAVLGEPRLSYAGWSYGSYLGAVYLQLFPDRADRVVLDSAVDPVAYATGLMRDMGDATNAALRNWAGWAAARAGGYHLGTTPEAVLAVVDRVSRVASDRPLRVGRYLVDAHVLPYLLFIPVRFDTDDSYAELAGDVRVLADAAADAGAPVEPTPAMAELLAGVFDGTSPATGRDGTPVLCGDAPASRDPETYYRDIQAHRAAEPLFGPLTRNITPCAFWPAPPVEPPTRIGNDVPALIVGATGDPRTPYPGQQAMHRALAGSRMVTLQGAFRHIVYLAEENDCVAGTVARYLLDGLLPAVIRAPGRHSHGPAIRRLSRRRTGRRASGT